MPETPQGNPETVEVLAPAIAATTRWSPVVGSETTQLLAHLNIGTSAAMVRDEALGILSRCAPPTDQAEPATGLVVGYVQSGKTISFTTVAALARDNGYRVVIVIAGVTKYLYGQSTSRLERDLRLQIRNDPRAWVHFSKPTPSGNSAGNIQGALDAWNDSTVPPEQRSTVLITVMKNRSQLSRLTSVLGALNLVGVPALIIDDEADQAGMNTKVRQGELSATYSSLLALRQRVPNHSFLQYTATPQAPLLINLIDMLSPDYARVLTPGPDYVGGRQFFIEQPGLIRTIPLTEIPTEEAPLEGPPESLMRAMRLFFLGVASGLIRGGGANGNRSMMVHPSIKRDPHSVYFSWVQAIQNRWKDELTLADDDPDKVDLLAEFRTAYADLLGTVDDLETFEKLLAKLPSAVRSTNIHKVNSDGSPSGEVNWRGVYSHILVGGEILGRGFTIEGLTVTYMPRAIGVGNADTVQQRARFFGYKRRYLPFCRVYLEHGVQEAYGRYVEHEEDVRDRLIQHAAIGSPLSEWKRAFFLSLDLKPTRANVLDLDYMQDRVSNDWFYPGAPHYSNTALARNRQLSQDLIERYQWGPDSGHRDRTEMQRHLVSQGVSLRQLYDEFLTRFSTPRPEDSRRFTGVLLQIEAYLESHSDATCTLYRMSPGTERRRELTDGGTINYLFQGESRAAGGHRNGDVYPGDMSVIADAGLTLQLHTLTLRREGTDVATNVPAIALYVPEEMAAEWLVQTQGGAAS